MTVCRDGLGMLALGRGQKDCQMFEIVLYQPEIPPNTGSVIRLVANTGTHLHLVHPLGFDLSDRSLARAGLDYHDLARVTEHADWSACREQLQLRRPEARIFAFSTRGRVRIDAVRFRPGDALLFGPETRGLPAELLEALPEAQRVYLPMVPNNRSMNLANTVSVAVFEAWRQQEFAGASTHPRADYPGV